MAAPGLGSRFMRQKWHTAAYASSWQASGDTAARRRTGIPVKKTRPTEKSPDREAGAKDLFATLAT
jgi:hypothetical protein